MPTKSTTLYDEIIQVSYKYLGPATDRFIDRQIESHLGIKPDRVRKKDLSQLIDWIRIAMSLLSDDKTLVKQYVLELDKLAK